MRLSTLPFRTLAATVAVSSCALAAIAAGLVASSPRPDDGCGLPPGAAALAPSAQGDIARHTMACRDLEHGRITLAEYRRLIGVTVAPVPPAPPQPVWASSVRAVSSQYSPSSWSAQQVLGPPDVYPGNGDNAHAWASRDADAPTEFIEVGFAQPVAMRELQLVETFNAGAISSVEVIGVSGQKRTLFACAGSWTDGACDAPMAGAGGGSRITHVPLACGEPVAAVRVTLASGAVPGWNELDAIGGVPCQ